MRDRVKVGWRIKCEHFLVSHDTVAEKKNKTKRDKVREEELMISQFSSILAAAWPFGSLVKTAGGYRRCSRWRRALKLTAASLLRLVTQ